MKTNDFDIGYYYHVPNELLEELNEICKATGAKLENLIQVAMVDFLEKNKELIAANK